MGLFSASFFLLRAFLDSIHAVSNSESTPNLSYPRRGPGLEYASHLLVIARSRYSCIVLVVYLGTSGFLGDLELWWLKGLNGVEMLLVGRREKGT